MSERRGKQGVEEIFRNFRGVKQGVPNQGRDEEKTVFKNQGDVIVINGGENTINIGGKREDEDNANCSSSCIEKDQAYNLLQELRSLTSTLRHLVGVLKRFGKESAWSRQIKHLVNQAETTIANHLSDVPILASSICRTIFEPVPPPWLQLIDLTSHLEKTSQIPDHPTNLIPSVSPHYVDLSG